MKLSFPFKHAGFGGRAGIALAVISGLLLTGSFPKMDLPWLSWIALVPLLLALIGRTFGTGFRIGFLAGLVHNLSLLYWVVDTMRTYGHLPWPLCVLLLVLLAAYLALYTALFAGLVCRICRKPWAYMVLVPLFWVALEYVRSFLLSGFPWEFVGYSQYAVRPLIQISDLGGVYGVSFLVVLANAAVFMLTASLAGRYRRHLRATVPFAAASLLATAVLIGLAWIYGQWRIAAIDNRILGSPTAKIGIVQGNIPQSLKWDAAYQETTTKKYIDLSLGTRKNPVELVVWPETATPFYFIHQVELTRMVTEGIQDTGTDFLIGSPSAVSRGTTVDYYNSAYLISARGKVTGKYDKVHLVPYGEYVPLRRWLPFLGKMVEQVGDFQSGVKGRTLLWRHHRLGVQICYEIIFPELSRAMVDNGAALLVNITNDAWYGRSSAPYQHFSMVVFRAVENRRSLVRSANTGISGFVDPTGRIMDPTPLFEDAVVTRSLPLLKTRTLYTRFGDVFAQACLVLAFLFAILGIVVERGKP